MGILCTIPGPLEPLLATATRTAGHSPRLSPQAFRMERPTTQAPPTKRYSVMSAPKPYSSDGHAALTIRTGSGLSPSRFETKERFPQPVARKRASITSEPSRGSCASSTKISFQQDGPDRLTGRLYESNRSVGAVSSKTAALTPRATPLPLFQGGHLIRICPKAGSHQAKSTLRSAAASTSDQMSGLPK